ncbi:MAG: hypothetical protein ACI8UO_006300 [Verrucomicrobiales bacterium]|jgi:hypothetical protein
MKTGLPLILGLTLASLATGGETVGISRPAEVETVDQNIYSSMACGPTSVLNAVKFGAPEVYQKLLGADDETRLRFVIDRYFRKPSVTRDNAKRFEEAGGVGHKDLAAAMRDLAEEHGLPKVQSAEVVRKEDEKEREFLFRVHHALRTSLRNGVLPIVALRSQVSRQNPGTGEWKWEAMTDHFVVITSVPDRLHEGELGFAFEMIDPDGGYTSTSFIYTERRHEFAAFQGESVEGQWLGGSRFLLVTAPRVYNLVDEKKADWQSRILTTLSFFVGS